MADIVYGMPTLRGIEAFIRGNVPKAIQNYDKALIEFEATTGRFPTILPKSGRALRIRQSGNALTAARQTLNETRISLNNFTISGVLPADFVVDDADGKVVNSNQIIAEFIMRDIALGQTFLKLSRLQMKLGETQAGDRSLQHAQNASDGARRFFEQLYTIRIGDGERDSLKVDIEKLESAIEDLRSSSDSNRIIKSRDGRAASAGGGEP